jgi:hypothetical protein
MKSKLSTLGFVLILGALILSGCGPSTAQPTESSTATPSAGPHINLAEQAGLTSTVKIEILELDLASASATGVQYVHRLAILDPQGIDQIVAALDMDLTLGPRARCPTAYSLQFHLADGTVQGFGYACDPDNPSILRGEQDFWRGQDGKPSAEFNMLIQEQLASAGTLSISELLENPVYDSEVRIHGEVSLLGELFCPCFELTSGGKEVQIWYGLMVEDDGTERPAVSVEGIGNGDQVVVTGELKTAGPHRSLNDFWANNIESSTAAASEYCSDKDTGAKLSYREAVEIAQNSECLEEGQLEGTRFCNQDTGTWWIDLDVDSPGCNPACVVNVADKTAEINWRCTGLLPPTTTAGGAARYEVMVHFNTSVTQDDIDEVGALLRAYDEDLEFLIMESWPPIGRALLSAKLPDFCGTVEGEFEGKSYVNDLSCEQLLSG